MLLGRYSIKPIRTVELMGYLFYRPTTATKAAVTVAGILVGNDKGIRRLMEQTVVAALQRLLPADVELIIGDATKKPRS